MHEPMPDSPLAEVLIVAAPSQRGRADRLSSLLIDRNQRVSHWPDNDEDEDQPTKSLGDVASRAAAVVLLADGVFASGRLGDRTEINETFAKIADRLIVIVVDEPGRVALSLRSADVFPARGVLLDLPEDARTQALERIAIEVSSEVDRSFEPQPAKLFEEYRLLFESTDRLVQRRRETTQVFFAVNAALSGVITFLIKDLALPGPRRSVVAVPLFIMGMVASYLWRRTIDQYAGLIDWRYRQIRRMERKGFVGSYRIFCREWEAVYAPRKPGAFAFSELERAVPLVFIALHALGICFAIAMWLGVLDRLGF